jgi:hypothetical protein
MVLSKKDKEEIAAMFEAFAFRMGPQGQQSRPVERFVYDYTTGTVIPGIESGALAFTERMTTGRQAVPFPEQVVGAAFETALVPSKRKKAMTKFNRAVKEGMKIVRKSSSYGKKGTITNSKKAFSAVTKAVSKARKGAKLPKKGVLRSVQSKAKGILGKIKARAKKRGPPRGPTIYSQPGSLPAFLKKESYFK